MKYIIVPEYISCVLLALIGVYMLFDKKASSPKETSFRITLILSIAAIINNIISIYSIENAARVPVIFNVYVNMLYFFSVAAMMAMVSITTYFTMFEGRYDEPRLRTVIIVTICYFLLETALVLANLATGWLFYFDESHQYHPGPLNAVGIGFMAVGILTAVIFGVLERRRLKKSFQLILYIMPAMAAILGVVQCLFPRTILTGTIIAFSLLTLFIAGQQQRARVDALTELSNREAFLSDVSRLCQRRTPFRIILVGLKNFKQVNGQFGQRAGDAFLYAVGAFLSQLEPRTAVYRTSGAQFSIVAAKMPQQAYEALFCAVLERFEQEWQTDLCSAELRAFVADIRCPEHAAGVDEVMASLEYATRLAKQDPNEKPVRFTEGLKKQFLRRSYVIDQMEKALREDRFSLNIQPVYDIRQRRFTGGEVLLRLNEDDGKPISPAEFIPIAIENGTATRLGMMVMEKTCRFLQANRDANLGWVSINVSSQQDEFDETVHHLEMLLEQYDIAPSRIKLEITEMVLLEDLERARAAMEELNRRGIGVYLDDFGTGYSNLVNVLTLPFECVKIDKGFIHGIATIPRALGMLQTVVRGLHSMNVIALAEGVETEEQDTIVRELGIDRIQGFYYARPMPLEEFVWLLDQSCPVEEKGQRRQG